MEHLHEEIPTISEERSKLRDKEERRFLEDFERSSDLEEHLQGKFTVVPFIMTHHNFEETPSWPPVPAPVKWFACNITPYWNYSYWKFSPYIRTGVPQKYGAYYYRHQLGLFQSRIFSFDAIILYFCDLGYRCKGSIRGGGSNLWPEVRGISGVGARYWFLGKEARRRTIDMSIERNQRLPFKMFRSLFSLCCPILFASGQTQKTTLSDKLAFLLDRRRPSTSGPTSDSQLRHVCL